MVEIFRTNVQEAETACRILEQLQNHFPSYQLNFDLDDCDKILRVEAEQIRTGEITKLMMENGFECELLN